MNLLLRSLTSKFPSGFLKSPNFLTWVSPYSSSNAQQSQEQVEEEEEEYPQRKLPADYDPSNFDPAEHRSPPSDRVFRLVDEIASLSLMEVSQLSGIMRKKLGMKEMPSIAVMKPGMGVMSGTRGGGAAPAGAAEVEEEKKEKTVFEVKLEGYDASAKIKIIKEVRGFTDLGLKEAKDLVEKAPTVVKTGISKEEGEKIVEKLKALGAKVVME